MLQDDHECGKDSHSRKLTSGGNALSTSLTPSEVEGVGSPVGIVTSLDDLSLRRIRNSSWSDVESAPPPSSTGEGVDPGTDDELNTSIGELTVKSPGCDASGCVLEKYSNGMMSTDSGVHSG